MANRSFHSTFLIDVDNSWNGLHWDYSKMSLEEEMEARTVSFNTFFQSVDKPLNLPKQGINAEKKLEHMAKLCLDVESEYEKHFNKCMDLKKIQKEQKNKCEELAQTCEKVKNDKSTKEAEIIELTSDVKQLKQALNRAIQTYAKHFMFDVSVVESSDDFVKADLHFTFSNKIKPIRVIIDRNKRKIVDVNIDELNLEKTSLGADFDPEFFCKLRQKLLDIDSESL